MRYRSYPFMNNDVRWPKSIKRNKLTGEGVCRECGQVVVDKEDAVLHSDHCGPHAGLRIRDRLRDGFAMQDGFENYKDLSDNE